MIILQSNENLIHKFHQQNNIGQLYPKQNSLNPNKELSASFQVTIFQLSKPFCFVKVKTLF